MLALHLDTCALRMAQVCKTRSHTLSWHPSLCFNARHTVETTQMQFADRIVDVLVITQRLTVEGPDVQFADRLTVEDSHMLFIDRIVDILVVTHIREGRVDVIVMTQRLTVERIPRCSSLTELWTFLSVEDHLQMQLADPCGPLCHERRARRSRIPRYSSLIELWLNS